MFLTQFKYLSPRTVVHSVLFRLVIECKVCMISIKSITLLGVKTAK